MSIREIRDTEKSLRDTLGCRDTQFAERCSRALQPMKTRHLLNNITNDKYTSDTDWAEKYH